VTVCVKESENTRDSSNFERGQIIGAHLAGASVTKTATLLGVSRVTVSKVMMEANTNNEKTTSAKRNSRQKLTMMEIDDHILRRTVLKNHVTTAAHVAQELNIHLEDPLSTKTAQCELQKSNIHHLVYHF
jgi:transposase